MWPGSSRSLPFTGSCLHVIYFVEKAVLSQTQRVGAWAQSQNLVDPQLLELAQMLPHTLFSSRADSTTKKYLYSFLRWKKWADSKPEIVVFPVHEVVCVCVCVVCVCVCVCVGVHVCACMFLNDMYVNVYMYVYVYLYLYVCMYVCVCCYVYAYMYVYVYNSGPPIACFEERHGSVVKSRAQSLVIGALCIE